MALTPEQIRALREKEGLSPELPKANVNKVVADFDALVGAPKETPQNPVVKAASNLTKNFTERGKKVKEEFAKVTPATNTPNLVKGTLESLQAMGRTSAQIAGGVGDILFEGVKALTPDVIEQKLSEKLGEVLSSEQIKPLVSKAYSLVQKYPEAAQDIGGLIEVLTLGGAKVAEKPVLEGVEKAAKETLKTVGTKVKNRAQNKAISEALEITRPALNKKGTIASMEKAGMEGGVEKKGLLKRYEYTPNQYDADVAESVTGVVSKSKGPLDNIANINGQIETVAEGDIKPFLEANKVPFNFEDLRTYSKRVQPKESLLIDKDAFETYSRVKERLLDTTANHLKSLKKYDNLTDFNDLWDSRKTIDNIIEEELGIVTFDSPQYKGVRAAAKDYRDMLNDFIYDSLSNPGEMETINKVDEVIAAARSRGIEIENPEQVRKELKAQFGAMSFPENEINAALVRSKIKRLSNMYEARARIAENNYRLFDKNSLERWVRQNPGKWRLIKTGGGLIGLGYGLGLIGD